LLPEDQLRLEYLLQEVPIVKTWSLTQVLWIAVLAEPLANASCSVAPKTLTAFDNLGSLWVMIPFEVGRFVVSSPVLAVLAEPLANAACSVSPFPTTGVRIEMGRFVMVAVGLLVKSQSLIQDLWIAVLAEPLANASGSVAPKTSSPFDDFGGCGMNLPLEVGRFVVSSPVLVVLAEPSADASCSAAPITLTAFDNLGALRVIIPFEVGRFVVSSPVLAVLAEPLEHASCSVAPIILTAFDTLGALRM